MYPPKWIAERIQWVHVTVFNFNMWLRNQNWSFKNTNDDRPCLKHRKLSRGVGGYQIYHQLKYGFINLEFRKGISKTPPTRLTRKEGALFRPPFLPAVFFFCAPSFFFLVLRALFLEPSFRPPFFFLTTFLASEANFWLKKTCFLGNFPILGTRPLSALLFFSFVSALFFLFWFGGLFFSALFLPSVFFFLALLSS